MHRSNNRPGGVFKWRPRSGLPEWYEKIPKATLYVLAEALAAQSTGAAEEAYETGQARGILLHEWWAQYNAGNVPQRPPAEGT
jgi:hypothetical protein